jgi:hypothetical protein
MEVRFLGISMNPADAADAAAKIVGVAEKISKALDKVHALKKEGQGIKIRVPERICQYDVIVRVQKSGILSKHISFPLSGTDDVAGVCMPSLLPLDLSMCKTTDTFKLPLDAIPNGTDYILLQFQRRISADLIFNLVETSVSAEPVEYADRDEYWMHAALKFPQILENAYHHLDLNDMELNVDVAVDNELKTAVPQFVTKSLRNIRKLLSQTDRNLAHRALLDYLQSRKKVGTDIYSIITQINSLFLPARFKDFVDVTPPFRYSESKQGSEFYDFPGQALPRTVTVVSRTDLNLKTFAQEGKVVYKKKDLSSELSKFF